MQNLNKILKNVLLFTIIFIAVNYVVSMFSDKEEDLALNSGNFIFNTSETEYSRKQIVTLEISNNTKDTIVIPNECPGEPFKVFRYENNTWTEKAVNPELNCENTKEITLAPGKEVNIPYSNWNHALFNDTGRFKIEFATKINEKDQTFTSNEFTIVKEGIFRQMWIALFYRPIYNGLLFFASIMPSNDLGLAIILLTLLIRTILLAPSQKAMKAQKKMQEIQPKLEKIKEKHKGDQQKIAMETMAIWKEAKVSPFGSCLPLLLQFPFLIALFYVIQDGLNPDQAYLLYSQYNGLELQNINTNFLGILELTKLNLYFLPLVIGALQFIQMKLAIPKKDPSKPKNEMAMATSMMVYIMPVMIAVFTASLPAGVGLYWGISTIYGIVQQLIVNKSKSSGKSEEPSVRVIES